MSELLLREFVKIRAKNCCEYCRSQGDISHDPFSLDHVFPVAEGGTDDEVNLAWSCLGCNIYKFTFTKAIDPYTGEMVLLFNPRTQIWKEHFRWSQDFIIVIGLTPEGRATIVRLQLNRPGLMALREALTFAGKHPPK
jgi:hypothetical protein